MFKKCITGIKDWLTVNLYTPEEPEPSRINCTDTESAVIFAQELKAQSSKVEKLCWFDKSPETGKFL
jgi:hypothetical protein